MSHNFDTYRGKEFSRIGLWFFIVYLYSKLIESKEVRYKKVKTWKMRCLKIEKAILDPKVIPAWLDYVKNDFAKKCKNSAGISLGELKSMANELIALLSK